MQNYCLYLICCKTTVCYLNDNFVILRPSNQKSHFVDNLKDFIIHFVGLSIGNHQFDFEVNDLFFERFEYSQLKKGLVKVTADLEKQENMMVFSFHFHGYVEVTCDRCGEEFNLPLDSNERYIVKLGAEFVEESDDMITIPSTEYKFDLAPYLYESLHLMLPPKVVHPDDEGGHSLCNPDTLRKLEEMSPHTSPDPRWNILTRLNPGSDPVE